MADPEQDYTPIQIDRDHPIVTQAWNPPYKPAALPLPTTWKSVMTTSNPSAEIDRRNQTKRQQLASGSFFNDFDDYYATPSKSPNLLGGSQYRPSTTTPQTQQQQHASSRGGGGNVSSSATGGFNAFAHAMKSAPNSKSALEQHNTGPSFLRRGSDAVMLGGLQSHRSNPLLADAADEDDEYDDRVDLMRSNMRGKAPLGGGTSSHKRTGHKSRAEREAARDEYRRRKEELYGGGPGGEGRGYQSGGNDDVDEGCVAALGEDDEYRAERLRFTQDAAFEDGTFKSPYHNAIARHQTRSQVKTPIGGGRSNNNNNETSFGGSSSSNKLFQPPGLRTPAFDPTANLPGPVARHQRRHHHHLLRLLNNGPQQQNTNSNRNSSSHHLHHHPSGDASLFPPHEIPVSDLEHARRKNPFSPDTWMLGDPSVDDVLEHHFMKKRQQQQQH